MNTTKKCSPLIIIIIAVTTTTTTLQREHEEEPFTVYDFFNFLLIFLSLVINRRSQIFYIVTNLQKKIHVIHLDYLISSSSSTYTEIKIIKIINCVAEELLTTKHTKLLSISFNSGTLIKLDNLIMSKTTYITTVLWQRRRTTKVYRASWAVTPSLVKNNN